MNSPLVLFILTLVALVCSRWQLAWHLMVVALVTVSIGVHKSVKIRDPLPIAQNPSSRVIHSPLPPPWIPASVAGPGADRAQLAKLT